MKNLYIALLHFPMKDRRGEVVATALTSIDVADIARTARTYGVARYFVVTPLPSQRRIAEALREFWLAEDFPPRREAMELVAVREYLEDCFLEVRKVEGEEPLLLGTSARAGLYRYRRIEWGEARRLIAVRPTLICFGTGHGMAEEVLAACDALLPPIRAGFGYNHLSVRAAVAITLDRLKGEADAGDG